MTTLSTSLNFHGLYSLQPNILRLDYLLQVECYKEQ